MMRMALLCVGLSACGAGDSNSGDAGVDHDAAPFTPNQDGYNLSWNLIGDTVTTDDPRFLDFQLMTVEPSSTQYRAFFSGGGDAGSDSALVHINGECFEFNQGIPAEVTVPDQHTHAFELCSPSGDLVTFEAVVDYETFGGGDAPGHYELTAIAR